MPEGFIGTKADILMDLVLVSFALILPALMFSWKQARSGDYGGHKKTQLTLGISLAVVVTLFEADLSISGGIFELTKASAYAGTATLDGWIVGHTIVAILTSIIWLVLIVWSLVRFEKPPEPNSFSKTHRILGRSAMVLMILTGLSAFPLYYYGFVR
jgi:putative membrane protein